MPLSSSSILLQALKNEQFVIILCSCRSKRIMTNVTHRRFAMVLQVGKMTTNDACHHSTMVLQVKRTTTNTIPRHSIVML